MPKPESADGGGFVQVHCAPKHRVYLPLHRRAGSGKREEGHVYSTTEGVQPCIWRLGELYALSLGPRVLMGYMRVAVREICVMQYNVNACSGGTYMLCYEEHIAVYHLIHGHSC